MYVADGATGDFLVDTWHDTLGNVQDLGKRESKSGSSREQPIDMDSLVKEAEAHMYAEKDCYYQESGAVRRS